MPETKAQQLTFKRWLDALLPPILWALLIFILSSQSSIHRLEQDLLDFLVKKTAHMIVFGILYVLLFRAVRLTIAPKPSTTQWLLPVVLCFLYAVIDELHQSFVPGRFGTWRDVGYDMLGVSIVFLRQFRYI